MCNLFQWVSLLCICSDWREAEDISLVAKLKLTLWDLEKKQTKFVWKKLIKREKRRNKVKQRRKKEKTLTLKLRIPEFISVERNVWVTEKKLKRLPKREFLYGTICTITTLLKCCTQILQMMFHCFWTGYLFI